MTRSESLIKQWSMAINYGPDGEENWANVYDKGGTFVGNLRTHHARAIVAALRTETAEPVAVKALEWNPFRALTPFGEYTIDDQRVVIAQADGPFLLRTVDLKYTRHSTLAEARAAAQADYEARIRSALVAAPPSASEQVERLTKERDDLRAALIAAGRHAGGFLSDEVSSTFLMLVPEEIRLRIAALSAPPALDAGTVETPISERHLAVAVAEIRQGERLFLFCEPPGEADIDIALGWVRRIEKARAALRTEKETRT